jgi:phosphoenolpyruvate carboxykinase (ATP)
VGGHPRTIIFLTADANGVLPPIARLTPAQARLWFLMGYTSKIPGTETGVREPITTFSRFFGAPFMPRLPRVYAGMLGAKMEKHGVRVFLVNTGWTGGPCDGGGRRMELRLTRAMVRAALAGDLDGATCRPDPIFKIHVPTACPGVEDPAILEPIKQWEDREAFQARAGKLAGEFARHFDGIYGEGEIDGEVARECPGR